MYDEFQLKDINYIQGWPLVIDFADLQGRGIFISQNEEVSVKRINIIE